jgi:hypothetical protein
MCVTTALIESATDILGDTPVFWGRYFTNISKTEAPEYLHATENPILHEAGIRLLPIARQTANVAGDAVQGKNDGMANAQDLIATFGVAFLAERGGKFYMFLDVEGEPSLSQAYFEGWSDGLAEQAQTMAEGAVEILPCVYGMQSDTTTWTALAAAVESGTQCFGAWIARYHTGECSMGEWQPEIVTPVKPTPFPCPILAWQYAGDCNDGQMDCSQTNPAIDIKTDLLPYLVLPPA